QKWYENMKDKGLRVKLAIDDDDSISGMIQYLPVEQSHIIGKDMYFIYCIWVHGHKSGIGNRQKRGMGKALLAAAEKDAEDLGAKGIIAWGLKIPVWMKAAWFRKQGYKAVDSQGMMSLVCKTFVPDAQQPRFPKPKKKPASSPEKVIITDFITGWCPYANVTHHNIEKIAAEWKDKVELIRLDTTDELVREEWGHAEGLFINGKEVRNVPPLSYETLRGKVERKVKRLR
ncbi:MAG: hypothetical protein U1B83_02195, partial [Candidatus Cloacimonadaceae bacterium]|nr:hypothetical protein [Candidatus Cloacimonadaceae bacterium]